MPLTHIMIYLNKITFKQDYRNLLKDFSIKFDDITLLVGDQGCGKSSILDLLQKSDKEIIEYDLSDHVKKNGVKTFYFDTEKMNPRVADMDNYSNPDGTSKGIGGMAALSSRFMSHGESLRKFTVDIIHKAENSVIFLDEPEASLSIKNQYKLAQNLWDASKTCQFVIATHSMPIIESLARVYDLENKKWVSSFDFINSQKII